MVRSCCALNCTERYKKGGEVTFHRFPSDPNRRKLWALALKRNNFNVNNHTSICSKHFSIECYQKSVDGTKDVLKKTAIPDVFNFSSTTKHIKKQKSCICSPLTETNTETDAKNASSEFELMTSIPDELNVLAKTPIIKTKEPIICMPSTETDTENASSELLTIATDVLDCSSTKTPIKTEKALICLPLTETLTKTTVEKVPSKLGFLKVIPDKLNFSLTKTPIRIPEPRIYLPPSESELLAADPDIFNLSLTAKPIEKYKPLIYLPVTETITETEVQNTRSSSEVIFTSREKYSPDIELQIKKETSPSPRIPIPHIPVRRRPFSLRYAGDVSTDDMSDETKLKFNLVINTLKRKKLKVNTLQKQNIRLKKKVQSNSYNEKIYHETKRKLDLNMNIIKKKNLKIRSLQKQNFRLRNKVSYLKEVVKELKNHYCFRRRYYRKSAKTSDSKMSKDD